MALVRLRESLPILIGFVVSLGLSAVSYADEELRDDQNSDNYIGYLRICNKGGSTILTAKIIPYSRFFITYWEASGWFHIKPGECRDIDKIIQGEADFEYIIRVGVVTFNK